MKKVHYFICLILLGFLSNAQTDKKITISFSNESKLEVFKKLETNTDFKFFYIDKWLQQDSIKVSLNFKNANIDEVLAGVLEFSNLNYYIKDYRVILTQYNTIYDALPANYFGEEKKSTENNAVEAVVNAPSFYKEDENLVTKSENELTSIGKEDKLRERNKSLITGTIYDSKMGLPIPNITITDVKTKNSAISDGNGNFKILLAKGQNTLEINAINYATVTKNLMVYNDGKFNIKLSEKINALDEVVINTKLINKLKNTVVGVTTIDIEGIKNVPLILGERDLFKVAASQPGIKTTGEGSSGYNVRGGKEDQNLILLDNATIYNPSHFFGFFSAVNPITIQKADIYKGSIPAKFGGRLSSVFDITSKKANNKELSGEGGIGPVTSNLTLETPIIKGKSSLLIGGRATYSGWILKSLKDENLKNSKASFFDGIVKYSHEFDKKNSIDIGGYFSDDKFNISSDSLYQYNNSFISAKWNHSFTEKNKSELYFTTSKYNFEVDYNTVDATKNFLYKFVVDESQLGYKIVNAINKKHTLNYGISSKLYSVNPGQLTPSATNTETIPITIEQERGLESAAFIGDTFIVSDRFSVDFGLRFSNFLALGKSNQRTYEPNSPINETTVTGSQEFKKNEVITKYNGLEPRVSARYSISDEVSIKGSYDVARQYIHLLSSNTTQSPIDTWHLSDLNTKPQQSQQFSLGLYRILSQKDIEVSLEGYYKKTKNILDYKVGAQLNLNENVETQILQGEGKAYGIEFLIKKNSGKLNGWFGYTYSRAFIKLDSPFEEEKVNNGKFFASNFDKPHDFSVVLNYKLTKRYSISSNFVYQTGRPITFPVGSYYFNNAIYPLYSDRNAFRLPDYYRLDIGFNIEGNHKIKKLAHSFWNISVYNVLGRNNPYSIFFVTQDKKLRAYQSSIFAIPIPTITYNFKF